MQASWLSSRLPANSASCTSPSLHTLHRSSAGRCCCHASAARGDNPSSSHRRTRRATTAKVEPAADTPPATSSSSSSTAVGSRRRRSTASAAPPLQEEQHDKQTQTPSKAPKQPQPRKKRASTPAQQSAAAADEPPHIAYTLCSAIGSYSDFNRCSVNLDELDGPAAAGGGGADRNGNGNSEPSTSGRVGTNGSSTNGTSRSSSSRHGTSRSGSRNGVDSSHEDSVRGLVYGATVRFSDSAALRLRRRAMVVWDEAGPRKVLIVKKPVPAAAKTLADMANWLQRRGLQVFVEQAVHKTEFPDLQPFDPATTRVDFAITLGGDGTVLHLASLFVEDTPLPPVMCFAMGTLGFLTPFDASQFRSCLARVLAANRRPLYCTLRTRKRCAVMDADGKLLRVHHILNECVVDRGAFPSSVYLELYIDGSFVTAAEADGLIIATPSGSTAYSMSAGGSMVAPSVPCTLVTPLSPHSLSFRPLIIPENADLMIRLPDNARSHARASFDGKHPMRIAKGCSVHFETSICPLPLINIGALDRDFFDGIVGKLKWNQSIRGAPSSSILQRASSGGGARTPDMSLGGLVADLSAAQNEAKVANWVEEALLEDVVKK